MQKLGFVENCQLPNWTKLQKIGHFLMSFSFLKTLDAKFNKLEYLN